MFIYLFIEEFLICTTDKAKQCIEETQVQIEGELKKKVERPICRVPGPWDSKSSDKDIEEIKPVQTREKVYLFEIIFTKSILSTKFRYKTIHVNIVNILSL